MKDSVHFACTACHYDDENVATKYENAFFYSDPKYQEWLLSKLIPLLRKSTHNEPLKVADIGGGTGKFTQAIAEELGLAPSEKILCIDPFEEMLSQASTRANVSPLLMDALNFSKTNYAYDFAVAKEIIHHIDANDYDILFSGIFDQVSVGGAVIIITRPESVDYPFFPKADQIWLDNSPSIETLRASLDTAGFDVHIDTHRYPVVIKKDLWINMIKDRFWSTFSHCSDAELDEGVAYLEEKYSATDRLSFDDNVVFLVGEKRSF